MHQPTTTKSQRLLLLAFCASVLLLIQAPSVQADPINLTRPTITGHLEVGQTLTVTNGQWSDPTAPIVKYEYEWLRCEQSICILIPDPSSSTYTLQNADNGQGMDADVVATDANGHFNVAAAPQTFTVGLGYTERESVGEGESEPRYSISEGVIGSGSISGTESMVMDPNLACPLTCGSFYAPGTQVVLYESPVPGATFLGWSGACSGTSPTCSLTVTGNKTVTATFTPMPEGGAGGPAAGGAATGGAGAFGNEGEEVPASSAAHLPARLVSLRALRGRDGHLQAVVACQQAKPCHLVLAVSSSAPGARLVASRTITLAAHRRASIGLTLNREGARLLARRRRLPVTAHLMLRNGRREVGVGGAHVTFVA